jgi:hypothetical protein
MTNFQYNDGGRKASGYKGKTGDCVVRAIAIATEQDYAEVYRMVENHNKLFAFASGSRKVFLCLESLGWEWVPTMQIGSGCRVHLRADELPGGRIICKISKHLVAVVDGVIHDTYDCSRGGKRCVYGYYREALNG